MAHFSGLEPRQVVDYEEFVGNLRSRAHIPGKELVGGGGRYLVHLALEQPNAEEYAAGFAVQLGKLVLPSDVDPFMAEDPRLREIFQAVVSPNPQVHMRALSKETRKPLGGRKHVEKRWITRDGTLRPFTSSVLSAELPAEGYFLPLL